MVPSEKLHYNSTAALTDEEAFKEDTKLDLIFNGIDALRTADDPTSSFAFIDHNEIFRANTADSLLASRRFFVGPGRMQFSAEVFYDSKHSNLGFDLELALYSLDVQNVRAHILRPGETADTRVVDWSLYKGAKAIYLELEQGEYEFAIICKASAADRKEFKRMMPAFIEYQLQIVAAPRIDRQQAMPSSLN